MQQVKPIVQAGRRGTRSALPPGEVLSLSTESFSDIYEALASTATSPALVLDETGRILFANAAMSRLAGAPCQEHVGKNLFDVIHPDEESAVRDAFARARGSRDPATFECRIPHRAGHRVPVECALRFVRVGGTPIRAAVLHARDLTERSHLHARLRHAQKLASLGQLSAGVADDLAQLLTTVRGQLDRLNPYETPTPFALQSIRRSMERAATLAQQMRVFADTAAVPVERIDVHPLVTGLRGPVSEDLWLDLLLEAERTMVRTDRETLRRVLSDLIGGFRDVMPRGSVVSITTRNIAMPVRPGQAGPSIEYLAIDVANTTRGVPMAANRELFEPAGQPPATGAIMLALVVLHDLTAASGGFVEVAANSAGATTIGIYLPVA